MAVVTFIPLAESHRSMLLAWLSTSHAREWWGEPQEEVRLIYAVGDGEHEPYIACVNGAPVAYIQAWWPTLHGDIPWQKGMSRNTRGIDITIGDAGNLGQGLGPADCEAFCGQTLCRGSNTFGN